MSHDPADLEFLVDHHQEQAEATGNPPLNVGAWRNACRQKMIDNERQSPGHITRSARGLRAKSAGRRLTYCKEVRGTAAVSYIWAADGTDQPPSWWNRDSAKADEQQRRSS